MFFVISLGKWQKTCSRSFFGFCIAWGMALRPKQIEAAQQFLRGVVALSSFSEIREKQWRGVSTTVKKVALLTPAFFLGNGHDCGLTADEYG